MNRSVNHRVKLHSICLSRSPNFPIVTPILPEKKKRNDAPENNRLAPPFLFLFFFAQYERTVCNMDIFTILADCSGNKRGCVALESWQPSTSRKQRRERRREEAGLCVITPCLNEHCHVSISNRGQITWIRHVSSRPFDRKVRDGFFTLFDVDIE